MEKERIHFLKGNDGISMVNGRMSFFFTESITRFAVPMYFVLSGIAFFRDYTNKKYVSKIRSRFFSLCIPFWFWNTVWMIFDAICSYTAISSFFVGRKIFSFSWMNVLKRIFLAEDNIPFWFLLYLIVFVLISPLFDLILRNKYVGILITTSLAIISVLDVPLINHLKIDAIVFYCLGGLWGKHYFTVVIKKTSRISQVFSVAFLFLYILLKNLFPTQEYFVLPFVKIVVFAIAAYALWSVVDLFIERLSPRPIYTRSFPVYAMHVNVSAVVYKICYLVLPKNGYMALPNFGITVILTITVINVFCIVFERYFPRVYALTMGKGLKKRG